MSLSWNEIKSRAIEFSKEWENESSEDAEAKTFWDGFFPVFGLTRRRLASFEFAVDKYGGGRGFIDLFWPGMLIVEHKSRGKDLDKAHDQAFGYFPGLTEKDLPKYILVSDFSKIRLYNLEAGTHVEFPLAELSKYVHLFDFLTGFKKQEYKEEDVVNIRAAEIMGSLYDSIAESGYGGHDLNVFLVRILFCLFAEDAEIFFPQQFRRYVENRTNVDGSDLGMHLGMLFQVLNTSKEKRQSTLDEDLALFEYVNGGLFEETLSLPSFTSRMRDRLLEACSFNWSAISPAIFGSLFQSVMDQGERRHLGAHYTSEKNILKLIRPLFLDDLIKELDTCGKNIQRLNEFQLKLASLKFLDPACGCGNFLIIAYREIRLLELEILKRHYGTNQMLPINDVKSLLRVRPEQFFGIEIEEFPAKIAQTALWLMDHQMNALASRTFGRNVPDLPLTKGASIVVGNALRLDWEEVIPKSDIFAILGNPPFIGSKMMTAEQRNDIVSLFGSTNGTGVLDYVSGWYAKASEYIRGTKIRVAFVSTNSITQGEQVGILWKELLRRGARIHFAHKTFRWRNEARGRAAVYCVIIGFGCFEIEKKFLFEYEDVNGEPHGIQVKNINPYLVPTENIFIEKRGKPICMVPEMSFGSMPNDDGNLLLSQGERNNLIREFPESALFVKEFVGAKEFLNSGQRWCLWLVGVSPEDFRSNMEIMRRIENVRKYRLASSRKATVDLASIPSLFGENHQPDSDYILVPRVSSENRRYIPIGFFSKDSIAGDTCMTIPNATLYHFGVLESEMHMTWVSYVCGRLESRYRYSKDIVYNNFPWPESPSAEKMRAVERAAQEVLDTRKRYPESSLADLYDPLTMPADLVRAHKALDRAVDATYGRRTFQNATERMNRLFELYKNTFRKGDYPLYRIASP